MPRRPKQKGDADDNFSRDFAAALESFKRDNALSGMALAQRLGVDETTLSRYLSADINVGGVILARALTVLPCRVRYGEFELGVVGEINVAIPEQLSLRFNESDRLELALERRKPNTIELRVKRAAS